MPALRQEKHKSLGSPDVVAVRTYADLGTSGIPRRIKDLMLK
jgi:hypothetical protein